MRHIRPALLLAVFGLLFSPSAFAQGWPLPANTPMTEVPCPAASPACLGQENLPTAGWSSPLSGFGGRFLDSQSTREYQFTFRSARARQIKIAPDRSRIYMLIGSALAAYDIDSFYSRLAANEPLMTSTSIPVYPGNQRTGAPEVFLRWDDWFYAESGGGWQIPLADGQDRLFGFDWDDRGNVYVANSVYGWGIARDSGSRSVPGGTGTRMPSLLQHVQQSGEVTPVSIVLTRSGGEYFVVVSSEMPGTSNVFHLTGTTSLVEDRRADVSLSVFAFAKAAGGTRIGTVDNSGSVQIYTNDSILTGTPIATIPPSRGLFSSIDTDGTNFYALASPGFMPATLFIITPSGGTYVAAQYTLGVSFGSFGYLRFGGGYLTVFGPEYGNPGGTNLRVYSLNGLVPAEVSLGVYFSRYYGRVGPPGYAHPNCTGFTDVVIHPHAGNNYLLVGAYCLGDVYPLALASPVVADAGSASDAGSEADAGVDLDSGVELDAGTDGDAGVPRDGGSPVRSDAGVPLPVGNIAGGCACGAMPAAGGLMPWLVLAFVAAVRAKRRDIRRE